MSCMAHKISLWYPLGSHKILPNQSISVTQDQLGTREGFYDEFLIKSALCRHTYMCMYICVTFLGTPRFVYQTHVQEWRVTYILHTRREGLR